MPIHLSHVHEPTKLRSQHRRIVMAVVVASLGVHVMAGAIATLWIVARYFYQPEATFVARPTVALPPEFFDPRMASVEFEAAVSKPTLDSKLASLREMPLALPDVPKVEVSAAVEFDPTLIRGEVNGVTGVVGTLGNGVGPDSVGASSFFGIKADGGLGLKGILYDLKQTAEGKPIDMTFDRAWQVVDEMVRRWDEDTLKPYFRAPDELTIHQLFIPVMGAEAAPKAFQVENEVKPSKWLIFYQGTVTPSVSGRFRFVGIGDDVLIVRFNKRFVLDGSLGDARTARSPMNDPGKPFSAPCIDTNADVRLRVGRWFQVSAGQACKMEILVGEIPGGQFSTFLMIQEQGKEYEARPRGDGVMLPVFQIGRTLVPPHRPGKNAPYVAKDPLVFQ